MSRVLIAGLLAGLLCLSPAADAAKKSKAKAKAKPRVVAGAAAAATAATTVGAAAAKAASAAAGYGERADLLAFADDVAQRHGLDKPWLVSQLAQARRLDSVQRLIMPPPAGTAKDWAAYRDRFVEPRRIAAGAAFWQANDSTLQRAEARYGVPAHIVVGIIGVETFYGRVTGSYRVIDALATLAFDFPTGRKDRSPFFRGELEEFFVMCRREGLDPQAVKGSFAGAMGLAQFMPGSVNRFAVDFDGDGHVDLAGSTADAIGSVAHYLAEHGWQRGQPVRHGVAVPVDSVNRAALLVPDILPSFSAAQFAAFGAQLDEAGQRHTGPLALVELQNGDRAPSYVAGTQNFYAITRYNWSSYYAMAVVTLGEAVAAGMPPR